MKLSSAKFIDRNKQDMVRSLYYKLLLSSYILRILSSKITLHKSVKANYLIHDYALKSKNKTKKLLKQYAFDNNATLFPTHRKQAIHYFTV